MDNVQLSKEQLVQLTHYIESRGFKEPFVIMEILDHFACKVEERMEQEPKLSFEQAMVKAHGDFGVKGFAPLVEAYNEELIKKYTKLYRAERKSVLTSIPHIALLLLCGLLVYYGYKWAELNRYAHIFGFNDVLVVIYLSYISSMVYCRRIFPGGKTNPIKTVVFSVDSLVPYGSLLFYLFVINPLESPHHLADAAAINVVGAICAVIIMYSAMRHIAMFRIAKYAKDECREMEEGYRHLMSS